MKTALTFAAGGAVAVLALTGCSSSGNTPSDVASSVAADVTAGTTEIVGPIVVEPSQTEVQATVGRAIDFNVGSKPGKWDIASDNPTVVSVTKGGKQDGAVYNPGAQALAVGEATVTLTDTKAKDDAMVYKVTVTE